MVAWAYTLVLLVTAWTEDKTAEEAWPVIEGALKVAQTMALLEVVHSLIGFVRSPVVTTAMQVASRIVLLWGYTNAFPAAQKHWSLWLMVGSWSLVEVPRYAFYAVNLYLPMNKVPYALFWARYSLFMILYPTGISGELIQVWSTLKTTKADPTLVPVYYISLALLALYVPGGPIMFGHMQKQRKGQFKKRANFGKPAPAPAGLLFPQDAKGKRSTTAACKDIFSTAVEVQDAEAAAAIRGDRGWRFSYPQHLLRMVQLCCKSKKSAVSISKALLRRAHSTFEFVRDGQTFTLAEAMDGRFADSFYTGVVEGEAPKGSGVLEVPYKTGTLSGQALKDQLRKWVEAGTIEADAAEAIEAVADNPEWMDLSDKYFVLLGAGSAMGPLLQLMAMGANIIAIDLDRPGIWKRLFSIARNSPGRMFYPLSRPASECADEGELAAAAGCNLFTQTPEIRNWINAEFSKRELTIGSYAYLHGALHVQVSLAMDAIVASLLDEGLNLRLAYLCTPTLTYVIPKEARAAAAANEANAPMWQRLVRGLTFGKKLVSNALPLFVGDDGTEYAICDGVVTAQGPNYALAKTIQQARAVVARTEMNTPVSKHVAPSTATKSVVDNKSFAAAYGGFRFFAAMEVFYQETSNAVMAAILVHDIQNPDAVANPSVVLSNPMELFAHNAIHGGVWRNGFKINSIGEVAALAFYATEYTFQLVAASGAVAALGWYLNTHGLPIEF
ncbi:protein tyrosine phosphatase [Thecamonas trahens ATCC 50062]|uniref:very-long-chain (3R)-3-hydroxyacyl-CoA dehydratase n=1 Tax=Thecamonas trahens ATCC 50062 TaxID=461836 RepID=A0A0L0D1Y2_THETB|nr:protein tyrosine phosphatase [Thecamonas trahens ATCC 50062]KNC46125.1 protein tyrosine phosphatase [Thecamonas trahens ATCC 50062]|eukprot:XP_013763102.1 protein tyrosine phosphatase [Thecamonas trahens ATCC 50062]